MRDIKIGSTTIRFIQGDITELATDAIVNAANSSLMGGGGVDGAIHKKGGPSIIEECEKIRRTEWKEGLPEGEAVITNSGKLGARFVIHTVGPIWNGGGNKEATQLANCYTNCLKLASFKKLNSIAFPAISTGAFGYPMHSACEIALQATKNFLQDQNTSLTEVIFILHTAGDLQVYKELAKSMF